MGQMTRAQQVGSWVAQLIAAGILLQTLFFKFTGASESVYIFTKLGIEPWGRIGSGVVELIAAVLLLIPRTAVLGALLSMGVISGAILTHLTKLGIEVQEISMGMARRSFTWNGADDRVAIRHGDFRDPGVLAGEGVFDLVKMAKEGKFPGGGNYFGTAGYAPFHDLDGKVPAEVKAKMEEIAKGLIETQGGRIWAESEGLGKGATVRVALPPAGTSTMRCTQSQEWQATRPSAA